MKNHAEQTSYDSSYSVIKSHILKRKEKMKKNIRKKMFLFEIEKFRNQRVFSIIVTMVLLGIYVYSAFDGLELLSGWSQEYFWENPNYREKEQSRKVEVADEVWIEKIKQEYQIFVDENRKTDEEIKVFMEEWYNEDWLSLGYEPPVYEEVIADIYNFENAMEVLTNEAYHSNEFERFLNAYKVFIPLSENAIEQIRYMNEKYYSDDSYSARQIEDWNQLIERVYVDFTPTTGYCFGWDILINVGQRLPYTLGLALLIVLCTSFSTEHATNMTPILKTTRYGRKKLVQTKLIRVWSITTAMWLCYQIVMFLIVGICYGLEGANVTVMHFMGYPSMYGLSNVQYYLIQSMFSYFGTLLQALFICLLSCLFPIRLSLPIGLVFTLVAGFPNHSFAYSDKCFSLWQKITALTPPQMMGAFTTLQTYQSYDIGIGLIRLPYAIMIAMLVEAGMVLFWINRLEGGK